MEAEPPPLEERRRLQEELSEFVESCCRTLEEVTASLGWSLDQLDPGDQAEAEVRDAVARPLGAVGFSAREGAGSGPVSPSAPPRCGAAEGRARRMRVPGVLLVSSVIRTPHCVNSQRQESWGRVLFSLP